MADTTISVAEIQGRDSQGQGEPRLLGDCLETTFAGKVRGKSDLIGFYRHFGKTFEAVHYDTLPKRPEIC